MFCNYCGANIGPNETFCHNCGCSIMNQRQQINQPIQTDNSGLALTTFISGILSFFVAGAEIVSIICYIIYKNSKGLKAIDDIKRNKKGLICALVAMFLRFLCVVFYFAIFWEIFQ